MRRKEITNAIADMLHRDFPDVVALLYGSEARGDARADSDIDILILLPDYLRKDEFNDCKLSLYDKLYDIELANMTNISPLIVRRRDWYSRKTPFTVNVTNDGIAL